MRETDLEDQAVCLFPAYPHLNNIYIPYTPIHKCETSLKNFLWIVFLKTILFIKK